MAQNKTFVEVCIKEKISLHERIELGRDLAIGVGITEKLNMYTKRPEGFGMRFVKVSQIEDWMNVSGSRYYGGFMLSFVLFLLAMGGLIFCQLYYGYNFVLNAIAFLSFIIWMFRVWKDNVVRKITYIINNALTGEDHANKLTCGDRLLLRWYGISVNVLNRKVLQSRTGANSV